MPEHYLVVAEADKIQDFVFRSAHLSEVSRGSSLLSRFCDEGVNALLDMVKAYTDTERGNIIVADGGSFCIDFVNPRSAALFSRALPEAYQRAAGGALTVAPVETWSGDEAEFKKTNKLARGHLNQSKREGRAPTASEQIPYVAYCASCGIGLADDYCQRRPDLSGKKNYLCPACQHKAQEKLFLYDEFIAQIAHGEDMFDLAQEADDVAEGWDGRNYVAYLVADGNGMGGIFGACPDSKAMSTLSNSLREILIKSLRKPAELLLKYAPQQNGQVRSHQIPLLPLILGGDDIFLRLPAPYALDFARRFCATYESEMSAKLQELGLLDVYQEKNPEFRPTIGAAIIICKSKYPYTLAHKAGEALLKQAKNTAKAWQRQRAYASYVNFAVILGHRLMESEHEGEESKQERSDTAGSALLCDKYRATLRPYWVSSESTGMPTDAGLPLETLIQMRDELKDIPKGRLAQLRELFAPAHLPNVVGVKSWQIELERFCTRVGVRSAAQYQALHTALTVLGDASADGWRLVTLPGLGVKNDFCGHGLPDLLEAWDFSFSLCHPCAYYIAQEA